MKDIFKDIKKFSIIPQKIDGATKGECCELKENSFILSLNPIDGFYSKDDLVELYTLVKTGMLYFKSKVLEINENSIELSYPQNYSLLQRREYMRIEMFEKSVLKDENSVEIPVIIKDISAGGMKLISSECLNLKNDYKFHFPLASEFYLDCLYKPIRVEEAEDDKFIISGRFKLYKAGDKIKLVQYCLNKQLEDRSK